MTAIIRLLLNEQSQEKQNIAINQLAETSDRNARASLTADTTFYVRADGSDTNSGATNSSGGAWLTLQRAMDILAGSYDFNAKNVTVQVGAGTYTTGVSINPWVGGGTLTWRGDPTTPGNVIVSVSAQGTTQGNCFQAASGALPGLVTLNGFKLTTSGTATSAIWSQVASLFDPLNIEFGACAFDNITMTTGGTCLYRSNYVVSGNTSTHIHCNQGGCIQNGSGNPTSTCTISTAITVAKWAFCKNTGTIQTPNTTFVNPGNVTGSKFVLSSNGVIDIAGGGVNYFPGTIAGVPSTGGIYV